MGKFFGWLFGASSLYVFCTSGAAIFIFAVFLLGILGSAVGESIALTTLYIILAMGVSYLLPFVVAIYNQSFAWIFIVPLITSLVFALPSSFVANTGCKSGNEGAIWAMRAIPVLVIFEVTLAQEDEKLTCANWIGVPAQPTAP